MSDLVQVQGGIPKLLEPVLGSEQVKTSVSIARTVLDGFKIESREDMEQAGDSARIIKRGLQAVADGLRDAFAPVKDLERQARDRCRAEATDRLDAALRLIDSERTRWSAVEQRRAREAAIAEQQEADRAAQAATAARESGALADDEEAPPAAQVVVHQPERTVRGAVATTAQVRKVEAVELLDPAAAAEQWGPEVVTLNARLAAEKYAAKVKLGLLLPPPDGAQNHVVGGVRFVTKVTFSDRARGR
jgi:hypothetical protein